MTRQNILMQITLKNEGMLGHLAMNMIEDAFKKNDSNIVSWKREGEKILVRSTRDEIMNALNTKKFNQYQKSVIIYTELKNE